MDVLALVAVAVVAGYAVVCTVWPIGSCRGCHGTGKRRSPSGRYWRPHRKCEGTGRRIRTGRRVVELFRWGPARHRN